MGEKELAIPDTSELPLFPPDELPRHIDATIFKWSWQSVCGVVGFSVGLINLVREKDTVSAIWFAALTLIATLSATYTALRREGRGRREDRRLFNDKYSESKVLLARSDEELGRVSQSWRESQYQLNEAVALSQALEKERDSLSEALKAERDSVKPKIEFTLGDPFIYPASENLVCVAIDISNSGHTTAISDWSAKGICSDGTIGSVQIERKTLAGLPGGNLSGVSATVAKGERLTGFAVVKTDLHFLLIGGLLTVSFQDYLRESYEFNIPIDPLVNDWEPLKEE